MNGECPPPAVNVWRAHGNVQQPLVLECEDIVDYLGSYLCVGGGIYALALRSRSHDCQGLSANPNILRNPLSSKSKWKY